MASWIVTLEMDRPRRAIMRFLNNKVGSIYSDDIALEVDHDNFDEILLNITTCNDEVNEELLNQGEGGEEENDDNNDVENEDNDIDDADSDGCGDNVDLYENDDDEDNEIDYDDSDDGGDNVDGNNGDDDKNNNIDDGGDNGDGTDSDDADGDRIRVIYNNDEDY
jgi:hypothetical protein